MIDLANEHPLPLSAAAREIPNRNGGTGVNAGTPVRWALKGCRGVLLETLMVGGIRMTTREAVSRFFAAVTAAADGQVVPQSKSAKDRQAEIDAAEQLLDRAGI